jgi:hypothetical protein
MLALVKGIVYLIEKQKEAKEAKDAAWDKKIRELRTGVANFEQTGQRFLAQQAGNNTEHIKNTRKQEIIDELNTLKGLGMNQDIISKSKDLFAEYDALNQNAEKQIVTNGSSNPTPRRRSSNRSSNRSFHW